MSDSDSEHEKVTIQTIRERRLKRKLASETKMLQIELASREDMIQCLEETNKRLCKELTSIKVEKTEKMAKLSSQLTDTNLKYYEAKMESMDVQHRHWDYLANQQPPILIAEQSNTNTCVETLQSAQENCQHLKSQYDALHKDVQCLSKIMQSIARESVQKLQQVLKSHSAENSKILEKYRKEIARRKALHDALVSQRGNIRVYLRPKPLQDSKMSSIFSFDDYDDTVINVPSKGREIQLDKVFPENASQSQIFEEVSELIQSCIDGHNVSIYAYGQTGSGKTYTMEGTFEDPGVNQRALQLLYETTKASSTMKYSITASMTEIYNETIRDLLSGDSQEKLEVKMKPEGGLYVPGLVWIPVESVDAINRISKVAQENRATASTTMNEHSSRSHCILSVIVEETNLSTGIKTTGRLNLVDLAGSERVGKSQVEGARLKEAQNINRSLSCLGDVINALKNNHTHVPYRNSKLTYLLQESLGGGSKTLMILLASSNQENLSESLSTLSFGERVRSVELNLPSKNTPSSARRMQSDSVALGGSASRKLTYPTPSASTSSGNNSGTPTNNLAKASSVPCRLNTRLK